MPFFASFSVDALHPVIQKQCLPAFHYGRLKKGSPGKKTPSFLTRNCWLSFYVFLIFRRCFT